MIGQIFKGLSTYGKAVDLLSRYKLWRFVILPGIVSLLIGGFFIAGAISGADDLAAWMVQIWPFDWGSETVASIMTFVAAVLMVVAVLFSIKYIVMVVVSPFMGTLSEQIEARLTGQEPPKVSFTQMMTDIARGIRLSLRNIWRELLLTLVITLAGMFIPVIGQIASTILIFLVQSFYAGCGNIDSLLERHRFKVKDSVTFAKRNRGLMVGNGAGFVLLLFIPVLGLLLAPGLGTAAATISGVDVLKKQQAV